MCNCRIIQNADMSAIWLRMVETPWRWSTSQEDMDAGSLFRRVVVDEMLG
jgi:hypothetical protein